MLKVLVTDKSPVDGQVEDLAQEALKDEFIELRTKIASCGGGPTHIGQKLKPVKGFEWMVLDYDIESYTRDRGESYYGIIYDTVTTNIVWTGGKRRRRRDAEKLTVDVLDILEVKFGIDKGVVSS